MKHKIILFLLVVSFSLPLTVRASGIDLTLYYGSRYVSLGGQQISLATDAYSPFYNPAAMAFSDGNSVAVNSTNLLYQFEAPVGANNAQRTSQLHHAPLFYLGSIYELNKHISVGLGVYPTALQSAVFSPVDYGTITGREWSLLLLRIEIAPSLSFKFNDHIAVGLSYRPGFTQYDSQQGTFGAPTVASLLDSSNNGWDAKGFKLGAHIADVNGFSFGVTYRPEIVHTLEGQTALTTALGTTVYDSKREIHIPAQLQLGLHYQWTPEFLTALTYEYTASETIKTNGLKIPALNALSIPTESQLAWEDGHAVHLGAEYAFKLAEARRIRLGGGIVIDSAVTQHGKPAPGIAPASAYIGYALGAQYKCKAHEVGMAFNYEQYQHHTTTVDSDVNSAAIFTGKYSLYVVTLLADYQFHF